MGVSKYGRNLAVVSKLFPQGYSWGYGERFQERNGRRCGGKYHILEISALHRLGADLLWHDLDTTQPHPDR